MMYVKMKLMTAMLLISTMLVPGPVAGASGLTESLEETGCDGYTADYNCWDDAAAQDESAGPGILTHDPCGGSGVSTGIGRLTQYVSAGNSKSYFASINPGNQVYLNVQPYNGELKVQKYEDSDNECRLVNTKTVSPTSGFGTGGGYSVDRDDYLVVTYESSYTTTGVYYRIYIQ